MDSSNTARAPETLLMYVPRTLTALARRHRDRQLSTDDLVIELFPPCGVSRNTYHHFFSSGQTFAQLKNLALSDRLFPTSSASGGGGKGASASSSTSPTTSATFPLQSNDSRHGGEAEVVAPGRSLAWKVLSIWFGPGYSFWHGWADECPFFLSCCLSQRTGSRFSTVRIGSRVPCATLSVVVGTWIDAS